ncbi:MAG TPA: DNA-3-methyladenine glycosylase [Firmicutes bacterium]|nr:DNA-3-methyladenine glycosylase [Bacillota bacterium]
MDFQPLNREFYFTDTLKLARLLLGTFLVHFSPEGLTVGMVVETEAYLRDDPACHAARGITRRNAVMFGAPGYAYVYFVYGNHYCFNVVSGAAGTGEAVLVRALAPMAGLELMRSRRRKARQITDLTNGPGKLCAAMAIGRGHNGLSLLEKPLFLARGQDVDPSEIAETTRIGITRAVDKEWRYYLKGNPFVSQTASR